MPPRIEQTISQLALQIESYSATPFGWLGHVHTHLVPTIRYSQSGNNGLLGSFFP